MPPPTAEEIQQTVDATVKSLGLAPTVGPGDTVGAFAGTVAAPDTLSDPLPDGAALPTLSVQLGADETATGGSPSGDLEVLGLLGEGGMGKVLLARQHSLDRDVAIKTAHDEAPPSVHAALLREGRIAGRLEHPAIVPIHALGTDVAGRGVLVMKRIEGVGWDRLLESPDHHAWDDWDGEGDRLEANLSILETICNAVRFAHSRGVVHRDIKPENVLIGRFGDVYLADWGVATRLGGPAERVAGTPGFMAPEMVTGGVLDERSDVYLLGATLHCVLTGRPRHEAETLAGALGQAVMSEPVDYPASVPTGLGELANAACALDPADRPRDALVFRDALRDFRSHRAARAIAVEAAERLPRIEALVNAGALSTAEGEELDRLTAETRFGLEQAREALGADPELDEHWRRFVASREKRRARTAELERIAHEGNQGVGAKARSVLVAVLAVLSIVISTAAWFAGNEPSPPALFAFAASIGVAMLIGTVWFRETLLRNTYSRVLTASIAFPLTGIILGRGIGLVIPIAAPELFSRELMMIAMSCGLAAVSGVRWLYGIAAACVVASVAVTLLPGHALLIFGATVGLSVFYALPFAQRDRRMAS